MLTITPIRAFSDNYIWILHQQGLAIAIDPGDAKPVNQFLKQHNLSLAAVLITHHHYDHTAGISALASSWPRLTIYGPANVEFVTQPVHEEISIEQLGQSFYVFEIPGHTLDHLAYWTPGHLFCGDTLFGAGCGRVFEGETNTLYHSLLRLTHLPTDTLIYPAHEYTLNNLAFALHVEPGNTHLALRWQKDYAKQARGEATLPTTLAEELETNPFLRAHSPEIIDTVCRYSGRTLCAPEHIFAELRAWKNAFKPGA